MLLAQVIVGGLLLGAIYALFSSGLTLIWGMMNFINFAHGEFVMLGMYVALLVVVWLGGGPAAFGFAAAFALFVLGVVVYLSLIRHVMRGPMLAQILSTLGLAAGSAGIAGALMAMSYPWSPSVGETFGLTAFVVVALGGFGSVPGAMYAGLIIGLIQALSAYWFGPIYKDIVVYALFVALLWLRPQGLMGKA